VYTLTGARVELPDDVQEWTRTNLRTYIYPPEYELFMHKLEAQAECVSNEDILAMMPARTLPTLHKVYTSPTNKAKNAPCGRQNSAILASQGVILDKRSDAP
jgi:hypothetical protein